MAEPTDEQRAEQLADELLSLFAKAPHLCETILPKLLTYEVGLSKRDHNLKLLHIQNLTKNSQAAWARAEARTAMRNPPTPKSP